jgi:E3 ubiquitin-protein ligase MYCBP2
MVLKCGHFLHREYLRGQLAAAKATGRIRLPKCGVHGCVEIPERPSIQTEYQQWRGIADRIEEITVSVAKERDLEHEARHDYYQMPMKYARDKFQFYMCCQCTEPYYGGEEDCENPQPEKPPDAYQCLRQGGEVNRCQKYKDLAMVMKLFWCCRPAYWFCWGTTYFCDPCHRQLDRSTAPWPECDGKCPFAPHPPNGSQEFHGCSAICEAENAPY